MRTSEFTDNTLVQRHRYGIEYLGIYLIPANKDHFRDYDVSIARYTVPGRCDTYSFRWQKSTGGPSDLAYYSEYWFPLTKALKLAQEDFNRPQVVEMCVNAFNAERIVLDYSFDFLNLLGVIAPKSKTLRIVTKIREKTMDERRARITAENLKERMIAS